MEKVDDENDSRLRTVKLESTVQFLELFEWNARISTHVSHLENRSEHSVVYRGLKDWLVGEGNQITKDYLEDQENVIRVTKRKTWK